MILLIETPGAGKLSAQARGTITTKVGKKTHKKKVVLAAASGATHAEGTATLVLRLASKYAKDLKQAGKLKALITVAFTPLAPAEALSSRSGRDIRLDDAKKAAKAPRRRRQGRKG